MFLLVEANRKWLGIGMDWHEHIKGLRLGWLSIHIFFSTFDHFINLSNLRFHNDQLEKMNEDMRTNREMMRAEVASHVLQ